MRARDSLFPALDDDLLRALSWCRLGSGAGYGRPQREGAFYDAEKLGLLAHDPIWRATPQGEGVLIALGLLAPTWEPERTTITILWAREPREHAVAQVVRAWPDGIEDCYPDSFAAEVEKEKEAWREWPGEGKSWLFWTATVEIPRA